MIDWKNLKKLREQYERDGVVLTLRREEAEVARKAEMAAYSDYCKTQDEMKKALFPEDHE